MSIIQAPYALWPCRGECLDCQSRSLLQDAAGSVPRGGVCLGLPRPGAAGLSPQQQEPCESDIPFATVRAIALLLGLDSASVSVQATVFKDPPRKITKEQVKQMKLQYYNSGMHRGALTLPQFMKEVGSCGSSNCHSRVVYTLKEQPLYSAIARLHALIFTSAVIACSMQPVFRQGDTPSDRR